jgi:FAD/FMN-containing dehydrogenase
MFDPSYPHGWSYYMRACDVAELTDEVIDITVDHSLRIGSPLTAFPIWQRGGAAARVDEQDAAFHGRAAGYSFNIAGATESAEGLRRGTGVGSRLLAALAPHHTSVYVNFLMDEGAERIRQAYGDQKYERLKALKRRYDPDNFFRHNQNIAP